MRGAAKRRCNGTMTFAGMTMAALLAISALASAATPQFPQRPIRVILGVAPGGGQENIMRAMTPRLLKTLGVNVIVDSRPGGSGTIAVELAKQAAPDGYTLLMISASQVINPLVSGNASYDLQRDFTAVTQLITQPYLLVVTPGLPPKSVAELIQYGKANPGKLTFGSAGIATATHLASELFRDHAQFESTHVPYKGIGPLYPDLLSGRVQWAFVTINSAIGHVKANRLRALAISSAKRSNAAPAVPTVAESGLPGYEVTQWYGILAPTGTPRALVTRLNAGFVAVVNDAEMGEHFARDGAEAAGSTPQQFAAHVKSEQERWARVIARAGLQTLK